MKEDVRAVANFVISVASDANAEVTNLSLNKIIYFLHADFLRSFGQPLVSAKIEAWDHGPVFREIYHHFKSFGSGAIKRYATKIDPTTGAIVTPSLRLDESKVEFLRRLTIQLLRIRPGTLVDMSHVEDGPWYKARFGNGGVNPGVEITNDLILAAHSSSMRH
jgi:uncharacterized phage-associated protein